MTDHELIEEYLRGDACATETISRWIRSVVFHSAWKDLENAEDIVSDTVVKLLRVVADQVNEPVLIIHGNDDSDPGTLTFQSEVFFEAVRGSGGTARLVLLPYEDHGYRARENIEHVLWEQIRWFDKYVKGNGIDQSESSK